MDGVEHPGPGPAHVQQTPAGPTEDRVRYAKTKSSKTLTQDYSARFAEEGHCATMPCPVGLRQPSFWRKRDPHNCSERTRSGFHQAPGAQLWCGPGVGLVPQKGQSWVYRARQRLTVETSDKPCHTQPPTHLCKAVAVCGARGRGVHRIDVPERSDAQEARVPPSPADLLLCRGLGEGVYAQREWCSSIAA